MTVSAFVSVAVAVQLGYQDLELWRLRPMEPGPELVSSLVELVALVAVRTLSPVLVSELAGQLAWLVLVAADIVVAC